MIVDTSALIAFFNRTEPQHPEMRELIESANEQLVVSPYVLAEVGYLIATRVGVDAETTALRELAGGAWELSQFTTDDIDTAIRVIQRYSDQAIGLADASNVVLADRHQTRTIATLDHRHFDVVRPLRGGRFRIVP